MLPPSRSVPIFSLSMASASLSVFVPLKKKVHAQRTPASPTTILLPPLACPRSSMTPNISHCKACTWSGACVKASTLMPLFPRLLMCVVVVCHRSQFFCLFSVIFFFTVASALFDLSSLQPSLVPTIQPQLLASPNMELSRFACLLALAQHVHFLSHSVGAVSYPQPSPDPSASLVSPGSGVELVAPSFVVPHPPIPCLL